MEKLLRLEKAEWWLLQFALLISEVERLSIHLLAICVLLWELFCDRLHGPHCQLWTL